MKSKLTQYVPMESIPIPAQMRALAPTDEERKAEQETLQQAITALLQSHMELVAAQSVEAGSIVYLSVVSNLPRFNRVKVPVTVGLGLYNSDLEAAILGKNVDETFSLTIDGSQVKGTILSVQTRKVPADASALVFDADVDGAESYESWLSAQQSKALEQRKNNRRRALYQYVTMQMNERCQPQFDPEEMEPMVEINFQAFLKQYGEIFGPAESMDEKTKASYMEQIKGSVEWTLGDALFGQAMGAEPCPEGEDEVAYYCQAFRNALHDYCEELLNKKEAEA